MSYKHIDSELTKKMRSPTKMRKQAFLATEYLQDASHLMEIGILSKIPLGCWLCATFRKRVINTNENYLNVRQREYEIKV